MSDPRPAGRLSTIRAAYVIARRDFVAILFSRSFIFFLLGPLFPLVVGGLAGGIGQRVQDNVEKPTLGIAMTEMDSAAMMRAGHALAARLGPGVPELVSVRVLAPGEPFDPATAMAGSRANLGAIVTGTPAAPRLTGPADRIERWQGPVALMAADAAGRAPVAYPDVALTRLASSTADRTQGRVMTAQFGQVVLFLLTMLLAGMVLSNLVEEKGNKIIEVLAAAIPMDAVFLGKLFAMLAVSWTGIAVWGGAGALVALAAGLPVHAVPAPAVGWPAFLALGVVYFSLGYLLLGSLFLAIGSLATTVREVQTLSMPVSMLQLLNFFFASYAMSRPGSAVELAAAIIPFSSPFTMIARAAQDPALWTHALAIAWQAACVAVLIRVGARLFRTWVLKSGSQRGRRSFALWRRRIVRR